MVSFLSLLLPVLGLGLLLPHVRGWQTRGSLDSAGWEGSLLIAAGLWGALLTVVLEGLSLLGAIRQTPLQLTWLMIDVALAAGLWFRRPWRLPRLTWPRWSPGEAVVVLLVGGLALGLLAVAWIAPPNNVDSQLYHMARVVHWAQNGSLRDYGTAYGHQLWNPPWAEMAILQARVLFGSDRPANLIQWAAYLGILIGVSGMARVLGLSRSGRWLAVAFAASIPMAVLQATSTQNDLVTAFWLVASACLVLVSRRHRLGRTEVVALGATFGLGLLTKGTFYVFGLAVAGWLAVTSPWRSAPRSAFATWSVIALIVVFLNLGQWSRNLAASGSPLGPAEWVAAHGVTTVDALKPKVSLYPVRFLRGMAPHLAAPWTAWNTAVDSTVKSMYAALGVKVNASIVQWDWNHEDYAGNPIHLALALATLVLLVAVRRVRQRTTVELAATAVAACLATVLLLPPAITREGVRLQLPLFVLWAPVFAAVTSALLPRDWTRLLVAGLLALAAVPWLLFNTTRPILGMDPNPGPLRIPCWLGCTRIGSVLTAPTVDSLFVNTRRYERGYMAAAGRLEQSECRDVGLRIDSSDPEYPIWWLLKAPQSGFHLETIYTSPDLEPLLNRSFHPCAIVCTICGDRTRLHGLPLVEETGNTKLFMGDRFTWNEDG